jgi:hypothetical protein
MKQIAGCRGPADHATNECGGGGTCPAVFLTQDGKVVVRGCRPKDAVMSSLHVAPDEDVVEVPLELFREALANLE